MKKLQLVENASEWKRWWSMRWTIAAVAFSAAVVAYTELPPDWKELVPASVKVWCSLGAMFSSVAAGVSRVIKQAPKE